MHSLRYHSLNEARGRAHTRAQAWAIRSGSDSKRAPPCAARARRRGDYRADRCGARAECRQRRSACGHRSQYFYEYFDDIDHALVSIKARALRDFSLRVDAALQHAHTPLEGLRALSRAWTEHLTEAPALAQIALRAQTEAIEPTQLSALAQYMVKVLHSQLQARGDLPGLAEPLRVLVVAALFDAVSRSHFSMLALTPEELQRTLFEMSLRILR